MTKMKALVTGGAGFIGSHLVKRLLREGWTTRVLDNLSTGKAENLAPIAGDVEFVQADIRDQEAVIRACAGIDCIWHEAALASVPRSINEPLLTHEVNVNGTLNVFLGAKEQSVPKIIFASSSSVYGETIELPKQESMSPSPMSPYAAHKLIGELYAQQFHLHYGIEIACLRYFNVFGPCQDPESPYAAVIPCLAARIKKGLKPVIYGDGSQTRDFTYIDNVVEANILASKKDGLGGQAFNIAASRQITVRSLAEQVVDWMGWKDGIEYAQVRQGDVLHSYADISRARTHLGYEPNVEFEEGLKKTLEWLAEADC